MLSYTYNLDMWFLEMLLIYKTLSFQKLQNKWERLTIYKGKDAILDEKNYESIKR